MIGYIEPWNEPDKVAAWYNSATGPEPDMIGFTKDEYAAFAKMVYDGDGNTVKAKMPDNTQYSVGVKNFPNIKMVMAGISEFNDANINYIDATLNAVPDLDVVNLHHYCDNNWTGLGPTGVSPENDKGVLAGATRTFKEALKYLKTQKFPNKELWLTEFGWDTNNESFQKVPVIPANMNPGGINTIADAQEVQGCWIVRGYLEARAAGCDKAVVYFLRDADSKPGSTLFQASGLVKDKTNFYQPKKSYWYVGTLRNILGETVFDTELSTNPNGTIFSEPRVMQFSGTVPGFAGNVKVYAVWTPTQNNESYKMTGQSFFTQIDANGSTSATMITMQPNDENGVKTALNIVNGKVQIPAEAVNERPIFVVVGTGINDPALSCLDFVKDPPTSGNAEYSQSLSCDAIKVVWNTPPQPIDHYIVYYYDRQDSETPNSLIFNVGDPFWKRYEDRLPGNCNKVVIAGLPRPYDNTPVVVIGVTHDGVTTSPCIFSVVTANCKGEAIITTDHMEISPSTCSNPLFDYQGVDFCSSDPVTLAGEWDGSASPCNSDEVVIILDEFYHIDIIRLLDGTSEGFLQVYYDTDADDSSFDNENDPVLFYTEYYQTWRNLVLPACNSGIKRLKFKMDTGGRARIQRIVLYGASVENGYAMPQCCGSSSALNVVTQNASNVTGLATASEIVVSGTLTINGSGVVFGQLNGTDGPDIYMKAGARIVVNPNATLTIQGNTMIQGCEKMWKGIEVMPGGKVFFKNSTIRDAYKAFRVLRSTNTPGLLSVVNMDNANVWANQYGLYVEPVTFNSPSLSLFIKSSRFDGLGLDLKPPYDNQPWDYRSNYGIYGASMQVVSVTGTQPNPTVFKRMDNGVYGVSSTLFMSNTKFEQIQSRIKNDLVFGGDGIYWIKGAIYQSGMGKYGPKSFDKVTTAFRLKQASVSIKYNHAADVDYAMIANRISTIGSHIYDNAFLYIKDGLSFSSSASPVIVEQNSIFNLQPGALSLLSNGITANGFATNNKDGQVYDIRNNDIFIRGEKLLPPPKRFGAGIYLNNTRNANVESNGITVFNHNFGKAGTNEHPVVYGIYASYSPDNTICTNEITGVADFFNHSEGAGVGIGLLNASNNKITCNVLDSVRIGLQMRMNCNTPNGIQGNVFLKNAFGIRAAQNPGASVIQGKQEYGGNRWITNTLQHQYVNGAKYEGDLNLISQELYTVNATSQSSYTDPTGGFTYNMSAMPPSFTTDWFFAPSPPLANFYCSEKSEEMTCKDNRLGRRLEGEGRYQNIAMGADAMTDMNAVNQWILRRSIYGDLREKYESTSIPVQYSGFYNTYTNTSIQKGWETDRAIARIGRGNPTALLALHALDSVAYVHLNNGLEIAQIKVRERDSLSQVIEAQTALDLNEAQYLNQQYSVATPYEALEKEMNDIYLSDFAGRDSILTTRLNRITEIADRCPESDGLAVFKARGLYLMAGGQPRVEWEACNTDVSAERDVLSIKQSEVNSLRLYPNPAWTTVQVIGVAGGQYYRLFDTFGQVVMEGRFSSIVEPLNIVSLPVGVYFMMVEGHTQPARLVVAAR